MALRFPPGGPVRRALPRARSGSGACLDFDAEVRGLSRVEQAVAFLALLELRKEGEIALSQAAPFAPIRISRASATPAARESESFASRSSPDDGRMLQWTARSA